MIEKAYNISSFNCNMFEVRGVKFQFVGSESTGYNSIETIDSYRDLSTGKKYETRRSTLIDWMIKNDAKVCYL